MAARKSKHQKVSTAIPPPPQRSVKKRHTQSAVATGTSERKAGRHQEVAEGEQLAQQLLLAITRLQRLSFDNPKPEMLFDGMLHELMHLTGSAYGFIGEVLWTDEKLPYLRIYTIASSDGSERMTVLLSHPAPNVEMRTINTLSGQVVRSGQPVIANGLGNDPHTDGFPPDHPPIHAFLGVPISHAERLLGMVGLANRPSGYEDTMIGSVEPVLSTCAQLLEGYHTRRLMRGAEESLRQCHDRFQAVVQGTNEGIWDWNLKTNETYFSPRWKSILGYEDHEIASHYSEWESRLHPEDRDRALARVNDTLIGKVERYDVEFRLRKKSGDYSWIKACGSVIRDADGSAAYMVGSHEDITERKQEEALQAAERTALELVAKGAALTDVLVFICQAVEAHTAPMLCSMMLVTEDGAHLSLSAGPSLPESYRREISRIPIGPTVGSCGSAAHFRKPAIVEDIATDPLWKDYVAVTMPHGLRACWSLPIMSSNGMLLGTFTAYHREPRAPRTTDLKLLERASHIARLAIEHAQMTEALRESEARFHAFATYSPAISFIKDQMGRYLYANPRFEQMFALSFNEIRGKTLDGLLPQEVVAELEARDQEVLTTGKPIEIEATVSTSDGKSRDWLVLKFPLISSSGERLLGAKAIDITERKGLERASQKQADRLRLAMDMAGIATWDWNILTNEVTWSDNYEQVKRLPPGSFDGTFEAYQRLVHPEDLPGLLNDIQRALDGQKPYHTVHRIVPTAGEVQWIEGNGAIYRDELGRPVRMVGTARNITNQKSMEQVLLLNEDRYARATAVGRVGVWELDVQAGTYYGDKNLKAMFGYQPDELSVDPYAWFRLLYPDDQAIAMAHWEQVVSRKINDYQYEVRMIKKDGTVIWTEVRAHAVRDHDGQMMQLIGAIVDITDRKLAETSLRDSEERYRALVQASSDVVYRMNPDWDQMLYLVGRDFIPNTDHPSMNWLERYVPPSDQAQVMAALTKAICTKTIFELEHRVVRLDGSIGWTFSRATPILNEHGEVIEWFGMASDITDRKRVEEELRRTQFAMNQAVDAVYWIDPKARILYTNEAATVMLGYTTDEFRRMTVHDLNPDFPAEVWPGWWEEVREKKVVSLETNHLTKDGRLVPIDIRVVFLAYRGEEFHCAYVRDISERKRIDQALHESQERFELAAIASNDGIWDWNILTGEQYWSDRHLELFGLTPGELAPTYDRWIAMLHPDDTELVHQATCRHLESREPYDLETRVRMKDGSYRWFRDRGQAVWNELGRPVRMVGSISDVTERRQAEEAIWKAHAELEQRVIDRTKELATANRALEEEIVQRKFVEARLERTQYAVDHAADQIFIIDSKGHFLDVNEAACRRLGYTKEELFTMSVMDIDPDFPPEVWDACWAAVTREGQRRIETRHRSKSGEIYPVEVVANYLYHGGQELDCAIVRDVTERKRIEDRLQRTQYAVDHAVDQVFFIDSEGKFIDVNETACHRLGFTKEELLQKSVMDIDPDLSSEEWAQHWIDFMGIKQFRVERRHRAKSGEIYPVEVTGHYQMSGGEGIEFVTVRDIRDRKQAEEEVRESQLRYKLVTESTFDAIALHDNGTLIEVNNGLEKMFGYEAGELLGRSILDIVADESRDQIAHNMQNGVAGPYEAIGRRKDGSTFAGEVVVRPYWYRGKEVRLVAGRDISARKQLEQQLARHAEELERQVAERTAEIAKLEAQRAQGEKLAAVGQLAAAVAHEINNPIAGIRNAFTLVKQAVDRAHPHYEFVGMIDREISRVANIVQNMYQLYRKDPGKTEVIDLYPLLSDLEAVFTKQMSQRGVRWAKTLPTHPVRLQVRQGDLLQVLMNLVQNAIDSSHQGGTITLKVVQDESRVTIAVSDEGSGIAPDVLPHIFDPFFTTKTEKHQKGMGLGLSVSQSMVMAMGGRIEVQTRMNVGSTFVVVLPQAAIGDAHIATQSLIKEVLSHDG